MAADAITTIGWSNAEAQQGATEYQNIVNNSAAATASAFKGAGLALTAGLSAAGAAAAAILKEGFEFNAVMGDAEAGIAAVLAKFQNLNAEAAKREASKAMAEIKRIEPEAAGGMADLVQGFLATAASAQAAGVNTKQNVELVGLFANALSNAAIPAEQLSQEMRSIFTGNIGADSTLAKILQITNAEVNAAKEGGNLYVYLKDKIGELGKAGDTTSVTMSSLKSAFSELSGELARIPFEVAIEGAKKLTTVMKALKEDISDSNGLDFNMDGINNALAEDKDLQAKLLLEEKVAQIRDRLRAIKKGNPFDAVASHAGGEIKALFELSNGYEQILLKLGQYKAAVKALRGIEDAKKNEATQKSLEEQGKAVDALIAKQQKLAQLQFRAQSNALNEEAGKFEKSRLKTLDELSKKLADEKNETFNDTASEPQKLDKERNRLTEINKSLEEQTGLAVTLSSEQILALQIEREKVLRNILSIEEKIKNDQESKDKKLQAQQEALKLEAAQFQILQARANGRMKEVALMERQLDIATEAKRIQDATGVSAAEALKMAKDKADLEDKANRKAAGDRTIHGYSKSQRAPSLGNPFRNLDAKVKGIQDRAFGVRAVSTPALDKFKEINGLAPGSKKQPLLEKAAQNMRGPVDNSAGATLTRIEQLLQTQNQQFAEAAGI